MRTNTEIKNHILEMLMQVEATHTYGFAIREHKMVKLAIVENADDVLPMVTKAEKQSSSHGAGWAVRMQGTVDSFGVIKGYAREVITLCSVARFEEGFQTWRAEGNKGTRGDYLEDLVATKLGATRPEARNASCTECGDINWNGEEIQLKLWNATITTEAQAERFLEKARA